MPKRSIKQIQKDQKKILDELTKNANKSINEIAQNFGFSRQKVWRIINNLEKNNTIWGYVAVTDEEKQDRKSYVTLIKRTNKPYTQELINKIVKRDLSKKGKQIGVEITSSIFTHGIYDWIICFNAQNIQVAKTFVEQINKIYEGYISDIHLIEKMFSAVNYGITNPEIKKLNEFFKI